MQRGSHITHRPNREQTIELLREYADPTLRGERSPDRPVRLLRGEPPRAPPDATPIVR